MNKFLVLSISTLFISTFANAEQKPKYLAAVSNKSVVETKVTGSEPRQSNVKLGILGGLTLGNLNLNANDPQTASNLDKAGKGNRKGFAGGVGFDFNLSEMFSLEPELLYIQQGTTFSYNEDGEDFSIVMQTDYLELPVLAKLKMGSRAANISLFAGPYASLLVHKNVHMSDTFQEKTREKDQTVDNYKDFDVGFHSGIGGEFAVAPALSVLVNARYVHGLLNLNKKDDGTIKTRSFLFMTGLAIGL
jgi:hypothetical protein